MKFRESLHTLGESRPFKVLRVRRWVLWWIYVSIACGIAAMSKILFQDLTRAQEHILLFVGIMNWILGGLICWALGGVRVQTFKPVSGGNPSQDDSEDHEWHSASDFLIPGTKHIFLPPSRAERLREARDIYILEHERQQRP